jgi:2-keto-3-deoxy-L-rhamnonate aldolase RhmA
MTRKTAHDMDVLTDELVEGGARELHFLASDGQRWEAAHHDIKQEFRSIAKQVIAAGQTAALVARSKRSVLP